jgi:hypothetical protein
MMCVLCDTFGRSVGVEQRAQNIVFASWCSLSTEMLLSAMALVHGQYFSKKTAGFCAVSQEAVQ